MQNRIEKPYNVPIFYVNTRITDVYKQILASAVVGNASRNILARFHISQLMAQIFLLQDRTRQW